MGPNCSGPIYKSNLIKKTMKKFLFTAAAIVCAVLLSVNLTSCGDDKDEPDMTIEYISGASTENEYTHFSYLDGSEALTKGTYEALHKELEAIIAYQQWSVKCNKSNQDEVLKREDEAARKKYAEMEAKVMAFKAKIDNLDKTQDKNKFDFSMDVKMSLQCNMPNGLKTLESRTINIKYKGIAD